MVLDYTFKGEVVDAFILEAENVDIDPVFVTIFPDIFLEKDKIDSVHGRLESSHQNQAFLCIELRNCIRDKLFNILHLEAALCKVIRPDLVSLAERCLVSL